MRATSSVFILLAAMAGCSNGPSAAPPGNFSMPSDSFPFSPANVRIHPLTHVEAAAKGSFVVLHLEIKDRYGDSIKWLGSAKVKLYQPGSASTGEAIETEALAWDITETNTADGNARVFDPATRTYRVRLEAPAWVARVLERDPSADRMPWLRLRVSFTPREGGVLSDEFVIHR